MNSLLSEKPLLDWLERGLGDRPDSPPPISMQQLAAEARDLIQRAFAKPKPLRPSAAAKQMLELAKHLGKAAKTADNLGDAGMFLMLACSGANRDDGIDTLAHFHYLRTMADYANRAAAVAQEHSVSMRDHKGGRTPDAQLRTVVNILAGRYRFLLAIKIMHTVDPETGLSTSRFSLFVKEALRLYAPADRQFEPRAVDDTILRALNSPVGEEFTPPRDFFGP